MLLKTRFAEPLQEIIYAGRECVVLFAGADMQFMPYPDVNYVIETLADGLKEALGEKLIGLYLIGSLTYGDFDPGSSDIDFIAVLQSEVTPEERQGIREAHRQATAEEPVWETRTECSYITARMLGSIDPPPQPRPYVNQGGMWDPDPEYGYEWLMNQHAMRTRGIAVVGPEPAELIPPIPIELVREASRKDFRKEWLPLLDDPSYLDIDHHQAFVMLTLCRVLHRDKSDAVVSKREASAWAKAENGDRWRALIERAERWQHGEEMNSAAEIQAFIRFVRDELA
jgi:hypothetical protein